MQVSSIKTAHLIGYGPRGGADPDHIIAVSADPLQRPTVIITPDGAVYQWGGDYKHFADQCFYIRVQPAYFGPAQLRMLKQIVKDVQHAKVAPAPNFAAEMARLDETLIEAN